MQVWNAIRVDLKKKKSEIDIVVAFVGFVDTIYGEIVRYNKIIIQCV